MDPDNPAEPTGNLATALAHANRLLKDRPALAEEQAREILKAVPGQPHAMLLLAAAQQARSDAAGARATLEVLTRAHPGFGAGWRALGDLFAREGDGIAADKAYAGYIKASVNDPVLIEAATALRDNNLPAAERILRDVLKRQPTDVAAMRMLAEAASRLGMVEDAENLLVRALELAPGFDAARHNYASILHRDNRSGEAVRQIDILLERDPRNPAYRMLKAAALAQLGEYLEASQCYESVLRDFPQQPKGWMSYGHTLKTLGRAAECVSVYRKAIGQLPSLGEAYWSLANLKTFRFSDEDMAAMTAQLGRGDLSNEDRLHFEFALGKALEDRGAFEQSFAHYERGNAIRRSELPYRTERTSAFIERTKSTFTREFFGAHKGAGSEAGDAIFIVGLPRSGSTLIEQILSSHSRVEGTMELHDIAQMARGLGWWSKRDDADPYPESVAALSPGRLRELGENYLDRTRFRRKLGKAMFIDKMPNNFLHVGLIHLMLPNAKIVDARRHPLGCCLSNFKQHFARGQSFSYGLEDIGRYYRDYVELMRHFDEVLPSRVHRIFYERMVADPEGETRALLAYCGLSFEEACLRFYENDRAVRTASSEQVRQPIFAGAVEHWRNYEPWLGPLTSALGPVLDVYPAVPVS